MWQSKVILKEGELLKHVSSRTKGFMEEEDIDEYSIQAADGSKTGSVTVNDHTAVRGFKRTITMTQYDANGRVIQSEHFNPR